MWKEGAPHPDHVPVLEKVLERGILVADFVRMSSSEFNADMQLNYAQAWALIHFLRHGTEQGQRVFDQLFATLLEGTDGLDAVGAAFGTVNERLFEMRFREHVEKLAEK